MSKMYCVGDLKASPWVGARPVLGTAPTVPRVGALQVLGGVLLSFVASSVRLDRALRATTNHVWGWCRRGRVGFAPTRHPSYSLHLSRLFVGSGPFGFQR